MATNLTPQQLAELQRLFNTPVESSDANANAYMPEAVYMDGRTYDKQDSGLLAYDYNPNDFTDPRTQEQQSLFNGSGYDQYGKDGSFTNSGVFTGIQDSNKAGEFLTALAMMAPMFAAGISPAANAAMSFGTNPVMSGLSNSGAIFSGTAGLTGAAGGAAGAAGGGGYGITGGATEPVASIGGGASGAAGGAGAASGAATGAGEGLLGTAMKYVPGLLGAVIGGTQGSGGRGDLDPRLQSLLYGDDKTKGGFSYARGLLDAPVAPNGFERFYGGK